MIRISAGRYAAVVATAALVVSLGGPSVAGPLIGTNQIQNGAVTSAKIGTGQVIGRNIRARTITGSDVGANALTGVNIAEDRLGRVPSATSALSAKVAERATDAGTVAGNRVVRVNAKADDDRPASPFQSADLDLVLRCDDTGGTDLVATTKRGAGTISTFVVGDAEPAVGRFFTADLEDGNFGTGVEFDLLAGGNGDLNQVTFVWSGRGGATATGTLVVNNTGAASDPCQVSGFVTAYVPASAS